MFETIAVLFVFFILVVMGFSFYAFIQKTSLEQEQQENILSRGIGIVERVSFLPEVQCSRDNVPEENCVDLFKLFAVRSKIADNDLFYFPIFGFSTVTLEEVFPEKGLSIVIYDHPQEYVNKQVTHIPIAVFHPGAEKYSFGILKVEVYS